MDSVSYKLLWSEATSFLMLSIQRKTSFFERNAAPHSHNFPNLETHQPKENHIAASFSGKHKLKVLTWKTITPPFSKILLVARFTLLWRHDGQVHRTAALTSLWLPPGCDQLTTVKTGYPLTSITWPYRGLRCRPIEVEYFLKLSADKLLVFKWSQAQV